MVKKHSRLASLVFLLVMSLFPQILRSLPYWDVVTTGTNGDTIYVDVSLTGDGIGLCGSSGCFKYTYSELQVTPCPIEVDCSDNTFILIERNYDEVAWLSVSLKLQAGQQYGFSGGQGYIGAHWGGGMPCGVFCSDGSIVEAKVYPNDYVAVEATTWGMIKSLFR
jgi:hypothetical protein